MKKSKLFAFILILISIQLLESSCMNFKLSESKNRGISQKSLSKSELLKSLLFTRVQPLKELILRVGQD